MPRTVPPTNDRSRSDHVGHDGRARMSSDERRSLIVDAARQEFARLGFRGASVAAIAKRAKCSEPMLYKHFASKQELFVEVLEEGRRYNENNFRPLFDAAAWDDDIVERVELALPKVFSDQSFIETMQLRKLAVAMVGVEGVREVLDRIQRRHQEFVESMVTAAQARGSIRANVDVEYVTWMWNALLLAGCYREAMEPRGFLRMVPVAIAFVESLRA